MLTTTWASLFLASRLTAARSASEYDIMHSSTSGFRPLPLCSLWWIASPCFAHDCSFSTIPSRTRATAVPRRRYLRSECLNHKFVYGSALQAERLVADVADKHQRATQSYVRRPYGVGLLVAAYDRTGPHLFQTCPSGNYYEWKGMALGARSQSAKTYLEKNVDALAECSRDDLIRHALRALHGCTEPEKELDTANTVIGVVGVGERFHLLEGDAVAPFLEALVGLPRPGPAAMDLEEEDGDDEAAAAAARSAGAAAGTGAEGAAAPAPAP